MMGAYSGPSSSRATGQCCRRRRRNYALLGRAVWWACQWIGPRRGPVWPFECLFEAFSPTAPYWRMRMLTTLSLKITLLVSWGTFDHLALPPASLASSLDGYSSNSLCHCLSFAGGRMLWLPICNHQKCSTPFLGMQ